jgi:hypothetical protein
MNPTGIIVDVSVKLPNCVSNFLFLGFRIFGRAPVYETPKLRHGDCAHRTPLLNSVDKQCP